MNLELAPNPVFFPEPGMPLLGEAPRAADPSNLPAPAPSLPRQRTLDLRRPRGLSSSELSWSLLGSRWGSSPHLTDGEQVQTGKQLAKVSAHEAAEPVGGPRAADRPPESGGPSGAGLLRIKCRSQSRPKHRDFRAQLFPKGELRQGPAWRGGGKGPTASCPGWRGPREVVIRSRPLPGLGRLPLSAPGGPARLSFRAVAWTMSGLFSFPPLTTTLSTATNGRKRLRSAFPVPCPQLSLSPPVGLSQTLGEHLLPGLLRAGHPWLC